MSARHIRALPGPADGVTAASGHWTEHAIVCPDGSRLAHVVASAEDVPRVAPVIWALEEAAEFEQRVVVAFQDAEPRLEELGVRLPVIELTSPGLVEAVRADLAAQRTEAVVLHGNGDTALAAAIAAAREGVSLVRIGRSDVESAMGHAVARLADLMLVPDEPEAATLRDIKIAPERIHVVGSPLIGAVRRFTRHALERDAARAHGLTAGRYALFVRTNPGPWPAGAPAELPVHTVLTGDAAPEPGPGFVERLSLERSAAIIYTDSERVCEEAAALGIPCRSVGTLEPETGESAARAIPLWDGRAGTRVAEVLVANFARVRLA